MAGLRLPLVIVCAGASLFAGCGGGSHQSASRHRRAATSAGAPTAARADLRSPDVDGRMDPASGGTVFACRHATRVEVFFDPHGTVAIVAGKRPLVYGTVGTRAVNRACHARGRLIGVPKGILGERDEATTMTCAVPPSARFEVHPISAGGREVGSTVAVVTANLRGVVLSAVLEASGSRVYYGRACRPG